MASVSGRLVRVIPKSLPTWNNSTRSTALAALRQKTRQNSRRGYASGASKSSSGLYLGIGALALASGGGYYLYKNHGSLLSGTTGEIKVLTNPKFEDYQRVYADIAERLIEKDDYDDGSYGPVLLRLAWHASGTYDKETGTGGSNGATMRFPPESEHGANAGLISARDFLEPVKEKFPWISYSDLWTLAGVVAIQEMQGPIIPWRPGRQDKDVSACTPDGRLPDATQGSKHLRDIFGRMGFSDQEIVALSGAHALGRCHTDRSGFEGPWTFSPTTLTNDYFRLLLDEKWNVRKWKGPKQYEDKTTKSLMMLPTDMSLISDKSFKQWVTKYARDNDLFFQDFSKVLVKLFELGVPFPENTEHYTFKPTSA
ncbi:mitochondrial putative cytochrome c peroxidase [Erysiphe pulchra]|uniref:Peroxidase n=1 Tax=Erysiphe pulchra TaxID=225359 RepID=A0A2S4PZJ0_9PEZI|nr:mitochondrial putative cytochrome c peroxidase [Erysiphe pulchra]